MWRRARSSRGTTGSRSTFGSRGNLGGLLHPGVPRFPAAASLAAFEGEELRRARTATPKAPPTCDIPLQTLSFSTFAKKLSGSPDNCEDARRCTKLAGVALLMPQGVAPDVGSRQYPQWCAAVAARVGSACALLSACCLHASQDRSPAVLPVWLRPRRLRTPRARAAHAHVRLMVARCRSEERGRAVCAMCTCVGSNKRYGTSGSRTRVYVSVWH